MIYILLQHKIDSIYKFLLNHIEEASGISTGGLIFFNVNLNVSDSVLHETIRLGFAIIGAVIVIPISHIIKVEFSSWYKKYKEKKCNEKKK